MDNASAIYDDELHISYNTTGSVACSVTSLAEVFVEWYLFDSSKPKTIEEFLENTCMKAGISADSWMDESCDVYKFQGQIFK